MNGVEINFMRKGYLLTALAAAVLLAASSGTAYAQQLSEDVEITLEAPRSKCGRGRRRDNHRARQGKVNATTPDSGDVASNRTVTVDLIADGRGRHG